MTMPELTRSSRYESVAGVSTGIRISLVLGCASALLIVLLLRRAVVYLHLGLRLQGAQCLVAADDDFVARLKAFFPLITKTPWTSSFFGSPGAAGGGAASVTFELPCLFAFLAASSKSLRVRTASA